MGMMGVAYKGEDRRGKWVCGHNRMSIRSKIPSLRLGLHNHKHTHTHTHAHKHTHTHKHTHLVSLHHRYACSEWYLVKKRKFAITILIRF